MILDKCSNHYGGLSKSNTALLAKLLERPDPELWPQARRIIISPLPITSVEMALARIGYGPLSRCPDPFTLYRAIRHTLRRQERLQAGSEPLDIES